MSEERSREVVTTAEHLPVAAGGVVVRLLREEDAEAFARDTRDPVVQQYGQLPLQHYTPEIVREQIDGVIADGLADGTLAVLAVAALAASLGLDRLDAHAAPENGESRRVLERAGFTQRGEAYERETPSGAVIPVLHFERSVGSHDPAGWASRLAVDDDLTVDHDEPR